MYVAHNHKVGTASSDPCKSGSPLTLSSMLVGQTEATGTLNLPDTVATDTVASATFFL